MRTLQVINVRWFNATAWYGLYLAKLLREAGHPTEVIALADTASAEKAKEWGFSPLYYDCNAKNPAALFRLYGQFRRLVHRFQPDIVNCHRGESFFHWGLLRKELGSFRLVRTRGDQRLPKNNIPNRWLHQSVADAVVATNSVMANHFRKMLRVSPHKVHTIYGGVDTQRFSFSESGRDEVRRSLGYTDDHIVIGLLGRFDEVKGQKELIESVARLYHCDSFKNIKLLLLGFETATSQSEVEQWIDDNGVRDITTITGKCSDVSAAISAIDLGVVASKWSETIARAALEIMACKRPLISTSVGVMPDLLSPEALFAPASVDSLTHAIRRCVMDVAHRESLREFQQQRLASLRGEDFLHQTLTMYESLL